MFSITRALLPTSIDAFRACTIALAVLVLSGCAGMIRSVSDADLSTMKNVGVASALSDEFHLIHIGTTIFQNEQYKGTVPDWKIDEFITSKLEAELSRSSTYEVGILEGEFSMAMGEVNDVDYELLFSSAISQGFDTLVVVGPVKYDNAPFHEAGYGLLQPAPWGKVQRCVYSLFIVEVYNVATEKELALEWGFPCDQGDEDISFNSRFEDYTVTELQTMETRLKERILISIERAASKLRLVPSI